MVRSRMPIPSQLPAFADNVKGEAPVRVSGVDQQAGGWIMDRHRSAESTMKCRELIRLVSRSVGTSTALPQACSRHHRSPRRVAPVDGKIERPLLGLYKPRNALPRMARLGDVARPGQNKPILHIAEAFRYGQREKIPAAGRTTLARPRQPAAGHCCVEPARASWLTVVMTGIR